MLRSALAALTALGILILGGLKVRTCIPDGTSGLSGAALDAAREALIDARVGCLDHPLAALLVRRLRVITLEVDTRATAPAERVPSSAGTPSAVNLPGRPRLSLEPAPPPIPYSARVLAYSFFGIPLGTVSVNEHGATCHVL